MERSGLTDCIEQRGHSALCTETGANDFIGFKNWHLFF